MRKFQWALAAAVSLLATPAAFADDNKLDGLEMDVMDAHATPNEASTRVLTLPAEASDTAREHAQAGLDKANAAREDGAAFGEATAEAARGGDHGRGDEHGHGGDDHSNDGDMMPAAAPHH